MVDPGSIRSISTSNERQLSSSLWEERVGWYMNLITPIRSPHWPLWRSSSSISPLYSSSSSSFLPLSISSFSPISCSVLNKTNRSDLPKRLQILTDCQAVHSPLTSPFFCHFFFFLHHSSGPYKCQWWFLLAGWWCMINSAFISSHLTIAFAFHQEQSVSTQALRGKDVISGSSIV